MNRICGTLMVIATMALAGCEATEPAVATSVAIRTGGELIVAVGQPAGEDLSVTVYDQDGNTMSGVVVNWAITSGGGSLSAASSTTGSAGIAATSYTGSESPGTTVVTATAGSLAPVTFTITVQ